MLIQQPRFVHNAAARRPFGAKKEANIKNIKGIHRPANPVRTPVSLSNELILILGSLETRWRLAGDLLETLSVLSSSEFIVCDGWRWPIRKFRSDGGRCGSERSLRLRNA